MFSAPLPGIENTQCFSILINPPAKFTIDDKITFYSLNSPTPTCFGASTHHPQGGFALQGPFHSEGDRLCNTVAITYNVYTHTVPYWIVKIKTTLVFLSLCFYLHCFNLNNPIRHSVCVYVICYGNSIT
jgi:hypothetical protein